MKTEMSPKGKKVSKAQRACWSDLEWVTKEKKRRRTKKYRDAVSEGVKRSYAEGKGVSKRQRKLSSKAARKRNSNRLKAFWQNPDSKKRMLRKYHKPGYHRRRSEAAKKTWQDPKIRKRRVIGILKSMKKAAKTKAKNFPDGKIPSLSIGLKKRWKSKENRKTQSKKLKAAWIDETKGRNLRNGLYKSGPRWRIGMTKPEKELYNLLKDIGYSYKWTGGGKGRVLSYVPDFMHTRFKCIIEMYGTYWHKKNDSSDRRRIREIRKEGYRVLVVWDFELKNKQKLEKKLRRFQNTRR